MWQGIQSISDYKPAYTATTLTDVSFLNELNDFYARFERDTEETAVCRHPEIYNTSSYSYRDRTKKEIAWKKVTEEVGLPVTSVVSTWACESLACIITEFQTTPK